MTVKAPAVFLTAEWKHLAMLNYAIEPSILAPLVPNSTELDSWKGTTFVSVVGFLFENTRVFGISIPFHRNFEGVNLRFYVWGYNTQRDGSTLEYRVEHPRWAVSDVSESMLDCDVAGLYGAQFQACLKQPPSSAFLADGSAVTVNRGVRVSA